MCLLCTRAHRRACTRTQTHTQAPCLQRSKTPFILIKENSKRHKGKGEAKPVVKKLKSLWSASWLCSPLQGPGAE